MRKRQSKERKITSVWSAPSLPAKRRLFPGRLAGLKLLPVHSALQYWLVRLFQNCHILFVGVDLSEEFLQLIHLFHGYQGRIHFVLACVFKDVAGILRLADILPEGK